MLSWIFFIVIAHWNNSRPIRTHYPDSELTSPYKTNTEVDQNIGPSVELVQTCDGVKPIDGIPNIYIEIFNS
jgi:hypothetical protein